MGSADGRGDSAIGAARAHENQRALGEGRVDEKRGAGERQAEIDVVQKQEGRERPKLIEEEQEGPEGEDFLAAARRVEEDCAEDEGADGDEDGGRNDEDTKDDGCFG